MQSKEKINQRASFFSNSLFGIKSSKITPNSFVSNEMIDHENKKRLAEHFLRDTDMLPTAYLPPPTSH